MFYIFYVYILFFFQKKTAYVLLISDWSSDVCSSDLRPAAPPDSPLLSADDARARLKEQGLVGALTVPDEGIRSRALDILMERKTDERRRQDVLNRAPSGFLPGPARPGVDQIGSAVV